MMKMCADQDVLAHRKPGKWLHDLESARDAEPRQFVRWPAGHVLPGVADAAFAGTHKTGDDREQSGLARPVGANESGDAMRLCGKRSRVDGLEPAEPAGHAVDREQRVRHKITQGAPPGPTSLARKTSAHRRFRRSALAA